MTYKRFYCYLKNGIPKVKDVKPENFDKLPMKYTTFCPNPSVAEMAFKAELELKKWDCR